MGSMRNEKTSCNYYEYLVARGICFVVPTEYCSIIFPEASETLLQKNNETLTRLFGRVEFVTRVRAGEMVAATRDCETGG